MQAAMGPLPKRKNLPDLDLREHERHRHDGYTVATITIASGDGDRIPAHLYRPEPLEAGVRQPAIIALHQTTSIGKDDVSAATPHPNLAYAHELAQRGYVVIAPDYPGFGDLKDYDFEKDRYVSGTMKGVANHMRCVDLLTALDEVDPERIGVIGHSLGGHNALFVGVFDERIKVVVPSCGWTPFHDYYNGKIAGWSPPRYMPRLRDVYALDPDRLPFDFYEVVAALAPRAFFTSSPLRDSNFDVIGVMKAMAKATEVYKLFGAEANIDARYPNSAHDFPPRARRHAYAFVDRHLATSARRDVPTVEEDMSKPVDPFDRSHFTGPWDVNALEQPPAVRWGRQDGIVREVYYAGMPYRGRPTRVFAYYARPKEGVGPFPAMLLVHGGGGQAFREWAELWANRGYVALAMDTAGQGPEKKRLPDGGPDQHGITKFRNFDVTTVKDMWTFHAVAAVLRGHSLLAAQREVSADRIGISGISWGGYLASIVTGIDRRLKVSVPVYGCGFLYEDGRWLKDFAEMDAAQRELWVSYFDPSRYLAGVRCPILFVNGTNDFAYPLSSYKKSYDMVPGRIDLSVQVQLPHGHREGWSPREIGLFVDSVLLGTPGLPMMERLVMDRDAGLVSARFRAAVPVTRGHLHFTRSTGDWKERSWETTDAKVDYSDDNGVVRAQIPSGRPIVVYLMVEDARGAKVSTQHETISR